MKKDDILRYHHIRLDLAHAIMAVRIGILRFQHHINEKSIRGFPLAQHPAGHLRIM